MTKGFRQQQKPTNKQRQKAERIQAFTEEYIKLCNKYQKTIKAELAYADNDKQAVYVKLVITDFVPEQVQEIVTTMEIALEKDIIDGKIEVGTEAHTQRKNEIETAREKAIEELEKEIAKQEE